MYLEGKKEILHPAQYIIARSNLIMKAGNVTALLDIVPDLSLIHI